MVKGGVGFLSSFVTGEFFLSGRSNGGNIILTRTLFISLEIYGVAILLSELTDPKSLMEFSANALTGAIHETIPWLGAIVAAVYAALYARYAAQSNYLASFYNQLMQDAVSSAEESMKSRKRAEWAAAFIEDAYALHLACRPMYAAAINSLLKRPEVMQSFAESTLASDTQLADLRIRFKKLGLDVFETRKSPVKNSPSSRAGGRRRRS